ncbi:MAG TPA: ABC transporter ATP-binding protein [Vicinamibacterales bacterium]|jgi:heme exporter protein A|nr:ABC transporter ATP-binding protein [Vicinamibacterales bacterium]
MSAAALDTTSDFSHVRLQSISRHYGRRRALANVTLECGAGVVTGLFGPNGAGKSTLIGVLSTLVRPSSGTVSYGDRTAEQWGDALRSRIGVLGHDLFLYGDLTASENLRFFAQLYGLPNPDAVVARALDRARLTDRAHDRVGAFSRGLRQRLALERALMHQPRLVLLDEPFTGLDDASAALLIERLRQLAASRAIVVMATHDFDLADAVVDEPICLSNGRLVPMTGAGSLRQRYRDALAGERA